MLQLIRHATLKIQVNGIKFLVDPMLSKKGMISPVPNTANDFGNPLVDLKMKIEDILKEVNAIILTHMHRDHFDQEAIKLIPKHIPIFSQIEDFNRLYELGFRNIVSVENNYIWKDIQLIRTNGKHGTGEIEKKMGPVSGFIIEASNFPKLYLAGDTIWCDDVIRSINKYQPDVIVVNGGAAQFIDSEPITMDKYDIHQVSKLAPYSKIYVVHMEAWNHCLLKRESLLDYISMNNLTNVEVPNDGELFYKL
ncbi:hypothetical protein ABE26_09290 [Cytobacillus firmus]|nr:hypothetical protein [Cytobacillus firmus]